MTERWHPADDMKGLVGDEAIMAFDMLLRPRYPAQRGLALGYLMERAVRDWDYVAAGYTHEIRQELPPTLALALSQENPAGPDKWRAFPAKRRVDPAALREHDLALVGAVRRAAATGNVFYCRPLVDYLRALAVHPAGGTAREEVHPTWGAREVLTVHIKELWLDGASAGCLEEVARALCAGGLRAGWVASAVHDARHKLSAEVAGPLRGAWLQMEKEPAWPAALVGAGLILHLGPEDQMRAVEQAAVADVWAPVTLSAIASARPIGDAGERALMELLELAAADSTPLASARDAMIRAVLEIDDRVVRIGRGGAVGVALLRAREIAKTPRFHGHERVQAALRRLR